MSAGNVCTVCAGRYRGLYSIHAGSARHQAAVNRRGKSSVLTKDDMGTKAARRRAAYRQGTRERTVQDYKESVVLVKTHRRSPPNDGSRKIVKVRRYLRAKPEHEHQSHEIGGERYIVTLTARNRRTVAVTPERDWFRRRHLS